MVGRFVESKRRHGAERPSNILYAILAAYGDLGKKRCDYGGYELHRWTRIYEKYSAFVVIIA